VLKQQYSLSEWVELFAFLRIAGPVGPERKTHDLKQISMYAGGPYPKKVRLDDFAPYWDRPRITND
jgi:hypothetical protein